MAFFRDYFVSRDQKDDPLVREYSSLAGPETRPLKMNLEERMAFRRELLFEAVKATLNNHFVDTHAYRFKVMRTDKRGHRYIVMFDMSSAFMSSEHGQQAQLVEIAATLTKTAQARYGLAIGGVYWRVDETLESSGAECARPSIAAELDSADERAGSDTEAYEPSTKEQLAAFELAWREERDIRIGDRTYTSDPAPLGDDSIPKC